MSFEPTAWCPDCHLGEVPDPLTEFLYRCPDHPAPPLTGSADPLVVTGTAWTSYPSNEGESDTIRAACAIIHRDRPSTA